MDRWIDAWMDGCLHASMDGRMDPGFVNSPSRRYIFGGGEWFCRHDNKFQSQY